MPKKHRLFPDVTSVSRGDRIGLHKAGLINKNDIVKSWSMLAPDISDRTISHTEVKQLVLLELEREGPREDLIRRLISYLSYSGKEQVMKSIEKILKK